MTMSFLQYLKIVWGRKWIVLPLFLLSTSVGVTLVLNMPKQYTAEASLVVDVRPDPVLGPLASPVDMATHIEIFKSDKVATRAVQLLGMDTQLGAIEQWRKSTEGKKIPLERFFATLLQRSLTVEPVRLSNVINVTFTSPDSLFAAAAANAFAQAAIDTSIELKAEPSKQSAEWFQKHLTDLRGQLEEAQGRLTKYQQDKGMLISDGQLDQETARLNLLSQQLADAQAMYAGIMTGSAGDSSPDVMASGSVMSIKSQLSTQEALLSEKASVWGPNHPERVAVESRIAGLKSQLAIESDRVRGGTRTVVSSAARKVSVLRASLEEQKRKILSLRFERDKAAVLLRDVAAAQRAYDEAGKRFSDFSAGGQTKDSSLRLLSRAVEPFASSSKKLVVGLAVSVMGGLLFGIAVGVGWELLDRRIRCLEDMAVMCGVPVIGVLSAEGEKRASFRPLAIGPSVGQRPGLPLLGAR